MEINSRYYLFFTFLFGFFSYLSAQSEERSVFVKKIDKSIQIDGVLDEAIWSEAESANDFWQIFPLDSVKANVKTSVKVLYNNEFLFFGIEALSDDPNFIVSSLKRDFSARNNDNVTVVFDTFLDGQNGYLFGVSAYGVQREGLISDRGVDLNGFNLSWDTKWFSESSSDGNGFRIEMAIPFSSIKYAENGKKWGFQAYRYNLRTNEQTIWTNVPQNQIPVNLGYLGTLEFEKPLQKSKTPIYIIPYLNGLKASDFKINTTKTTLKVGGDLKIPIGNGLNLDVTLNPDFSNVEVDNVITNLTRFEISLPEKRQFFIDNGDLFGKFGSFRDAIPFFSRRIGIARDKEGNNIQNTILGGVRLSGKIDENWRLGVLNIQNKEDLTNQIASNNNTMVALQRKVFGQSQMGMFFVNRETFGDYDFVSENEKYNRVIGLDYNLASTNNKWIGKFYTHKSFQPNDTKGNLSSQAFLTYNTRIWRFSSDWVYVDRDYRSDLGFIPRTGIFKSGANAVRTFYPKESNIISHKLGILNLMWFQQNLDYKKTDHMTRYSYIAQFKNLAQLQLNYNNDYVYLSNSFDPSRTGATPLPGSAGYKFNSWNIAYISNYANLFNFTTEMGYGDFFNGTKFSFKGNLNYRFQPKVALSLLWDYNKVNLPKPYAQSNLILVSPKVEVTLNKQLFWSTLVQYSNQTDNLGINSRIQWRFAPLSDLFLVYNDNYYSEAFIPTFRSINLKFTYWLNL
jgi:hypothetical protein